MPPLRRGLELDRLDDDPLQSPASLGAALTVNQEAALLWALSLQPHARPQSMEEFSGRLFKREPISGPTPGPMPGPEVAPPYHQPAENRFSSPPSGGTDEVVPPVQPGYCPPPRRPCTGGRSGKPRAYDANIRPNFITQRA